MKKYRQVVSTLLCLLAFGFVVAACGGSSPTATPTHVATEFIDGLNHGDFRQACSAIQPSVRKHLWRTMSRCESYFTATNGQAVLFGYMLGGYKIVPHSYRGWREGKTEVATVNVVYAPTGGAYLTVRLVKTRYGWRVASLS